MFIVVISVFRS